ncbi:unnamed protein product [Cuscuta epithymum]|uniref:Peptidase A1 domain-containing protein n=1 Tax=Cuscuta epithymum TaxID=186058 RepID=A0AAV0EIT5_9ASTE|nr:unnamed protein product [Cuscuta epithymum]
MHSEKVISALGRKGLPKQGTVEYYSAWITHDQHGHGGAPTHHLPALTFAGGDAITAIEKLGNLHYAEIRVGTPPVSFMVAIDTGSDISWFPCGCTDCAHFYETSMGQPKILNSYSPKSSSTSSAPVIFGCGMVETGTILEKGAVNGLLGLGFNTSLDVPTVLTSKGLVPNSLSLCLRLETKVVLTR